MLRKIDTVATAVVILLGLGHLAFTPIFAPGLNERTVWFAGSGLALLYLGFLNWARLLLVAPRLRQLCVVANHVTLVWTVLVLLVLPVPQAGVATLAVALVTVGSLRAVGVR